MTRATGKPSAQALAAVACAALAGLSLLLPSGPTYDPYQWLIWGRDLAHLELATGGTGTSWKPLPAIVAALLAPLGHAQAAAWLVVARAGALFAAVMAFRLAARLTGGRLAWVAGTVAAATVLLTHQLVRRTAVGNVEALAAALVLLAVERHLDGRRGQAFALGIAAALTRPESWPLVAAYGLWLARERSGVPRRGLAAGALLVPVLWFGGDWLGSGRLWTAADRALRPVKGSPGAGTHPALAVFQEAWQMLPLPARIAVPAALVAVVVDARRRRAGVHRARASDPRRGRAGMDRERHGLTLALAGGALAWTAIVAAMAQRGYAGLARFLFPAMAMVAPLAGAGAARVADLLARPWPRRSAPVAAVVLAVFALAATPDAALLRADAAATDTVADRDAGLAAAIATAGGPRAVLGCGRPYTGWFAVTALAYDLGVQARQVRTRPHGRSPVVFIPARGVTGLRAPLPRRDVRTAVDTGGWDVFERCARPTGSTHMTAEGASGGILGAWSRPTTRARGASRTASTRAGWPTVSTSASSSAA